MGHVDVRGDARQVPQMFDAAQDRETRHGLTFRLAGETLQAQPCGALWWPDRRALAVSDLHLEKGSAYASQGQMLPPFDTRAALLRIAALVERLRPALLISLGDTLHDRRASQRMSAEDALLIRSLTAACDVVWIEGNHDPAPPVHLGGRQAAELRLGPLIFRHLPTPGRAPGEVAGHLHPCARIWGRGRSVRVRCFVGDGERLVMPAYGALAGGLNVCDPAFRDLFEGEVGVAALGRDGVYAARADRLLPDRVMAA